MDQGGGDERKWKHDGSRTDREPCAVRRSGVSVERVRPVESEDKGADLVRLACSAILDHIGEESYGAGPARDALQGLKVRLEFRRPDLVHLVDEALRG
jgi:hypothetical protein